MRYFISILILCAIFFQGSGAAAQTFRNGRAQKYIEQKMKEEPFRSGITGILAVTVGGDTIAEYRSLQKMIPASNTKLISTGLAINILGSNYRYSTGIGYNGHIAGGCLHGDLYIIGGGDPTIASGDFMSMPKDTLFRRWLEILASAGIRKIDGNIIGDGRYFDGPIENDSWSYNDLGTYYGTGGNGLCFYRNVLDVNVSAGAAGGHVNAQPAYPELPWLEFRNAAVTAPAGTGNNLYLFNTDLTPVAELRGSFACDRAAKKEEYSNKYGALTCAWYFMQFLDSKSFEVSGRAAEIDGYGMVRAFAPGHGNKGRLVIEKPAAAPEEIMVLGETKSPTVSEIAKVTNSRSDNFYAETLFRTISKKRTGSACYDSAKVVIIREFKSLGIDPGYGVRMVDGSGLARHNYMSPDFYCRFLEAMSRTPSFQSYLKTIGHPGEGTMAMRLQSQPASVKRRVYMKSGSMNGVLCYSGYIMPASGLKEDMVIFSIMTNNMPGPVRPVASFIDTLIPMLVR